MGQPADGCRSIAPRHLLGRNGHLAVSRRAAAPVLHIDAQAGEAQFGESAPGVPLELGALVRPPGLGRDLAVHEIPQGGLEHLLLFIQYQVGHDLLLLTFQPQLS